MAKASDFQPEGPGSDLSLWHTYFIIVKIDNTHMGIALNFKISNLQSQNLSFSGQECFVFEPGMFWLEFASALHLSCHERLGTWGCLRDISEISWGRRDLMLMWTQTKTPLAWSCEHKLNHKQTKHNPRCVLNGKSDYEAVLRFHYLPVWPGPCGSRDVSHDDHEEDPQEIHFLSAAAAIVNCGVSWRRVV